MKKAYLQSQLKSKGTAYLWYFFFGCHFGYLGKWGTQLLFWFTLYGIGIWGIIELFKVGDRVEQHNRLILNQIDEIEKQEKDESFQKHMLIAKAMQKD